MKLLLDTHIWLWWLAQPDRLSPQAIELIRDLDNTCLFSAASAWEIAIKTSLGKLTLPLPVDEFVTARLFETQMTRLDVTVEHAVRVASLPWHHRDPFDRLLVAQAQVEKAVFVTADGKLQSYDVDMILAGAGR
jgi:PIN domain nuclease of toxin-antitoxin system